MTKKIFFNEAHLMVYAYNKSDINNVTKGQVLKRDTCYECAICIYFNVTEMSFLH